MQTDIENYTVSTQRSPSPIATPELLIQQLWE